jgi:hypothetical protein
MTWAELQKVQAEGETLPMEWPLLQQFAGREQELATFGVSDVRKLAEKVYALTLAPGESSQPRGTGHPGLTGQSGRQGGQGDIGAQ